MENKYALINNNIVENLAIIEGDENLKYFKDKFEEVISLNSDATSLVSVGWILDNGVLFPPKINETIPKILSSVDFLNRFTLMERSKITDASSNDTLIKIWWELINKLVDVNLEDPNVLEGLDYAIGKNLLKPERKDQILA